jgi:hypothetical protein
MKNQRAKILNTLISRCLTRAGHTWHISALLVRGTDNIRDAWQTALALAAYQFRVGLVARVISSRPLSLRRATTASGAGLRRLLGLCVGLRERSYMSAFDVRAYSLRLEQIFAVAQLRSKQVCCVVVLLGSRFCIFV